MSEYTELQDAILTAMDAVIANGKAVNRYADVVNEQVAQLWADNAELRDELHAVANRVESLTRGLLADPAEVAQAIVNDANRNRLHALTGRPLVLAGGKGDPIDCLACRGSGATPEGVRCDKCNGYGQIVHQ